MTRTNDERNALNRKVCRLMIEHLATDGWRFAFADDEPVLDMPIEAAVEEVFELDGARMRFLSRTGNRMHWVMFTPYNTGVECIADWSYSVDDADGFHKLMDDFLEKYDTEEYR